MQKIPVIAVFDIGKTNKKLLLFDEQYQLIDEHSVRFDEIQDEDGFPCENLDNLRLSVFDTLKTILARPDIEVRAINFATYGASFVYLDKHGAELTPLYNYLKPYPEDIKQAFYHTHGEAQQISLETASPELGSLNSGMQLYRIKKQRPDIFNNIRYALHLPQYMSYILSGVFLTDITSIGCHTQLWDFKNNCYHNWVKREGIVEKFAPLANCKYTIRSSFSSLPFKVGIGVHDSSAALIPYLVSFREPFVLLSTGTWCISLNPFNTEPLTVEELRKDCLCYFSFDGKPVKASRLFAGYEHEQHLDRIADHFSQQTAKYKTMSFDPAIAVSLKRKERLGNSTVPKTKGFAFEGRDLNDFANDTEAYHQLVMDIIAVQVQATSLVVDKSRSVKRIFVDGGFSRNSIYMNLLAASFPDMEVYAAAMAQASALGAALAIHSSWNEYAMPKDIIELKFYAAEQVQQS